MTDRELYMQLHAQLQMARALLHDVFTAVYVPELREKIARYLGIPNSPLKPEPPCPHECQHTNCEHKVDKWLEDNNVG